jgi:catechol-2,3-dioxygenase
MTDTLTLGIHRVGLAVPDLDAARAFFIDALGWNVVGEVPDYPAIFVSNGHALLTLWRVADPELKSRGLIGSMHIRHRTDGRRAHASQKALSSSSHCRPWPRNQSTACSTESKNDASRSLNIRRN